MMDGLQEAESLRKQLDGVQRRTSDLDSAALREQKEKAAASEVCMPCWSVVTCVFIPS